MYSASRPAANTALGRQRYPAMTLPDHTSPRPLSGVKLYPPSPPTYQLCVLYAGTSGGAAYGVHGAAGAAASGGAAILPLRTGSAACASVAQPTSSTAASSRKP